MAGTEETAATREWEAEAILTRDRAVIPTQGRAEEETGAADVAEGQTSQVTWTPGPCGN